MNAATESAVQRAERDLQNSSSEVKSLRAQLDELKAKMHAELKTPSSGETGVKKFEEKTGRLSNSSSGSHTPIATQKVLSASDRSNSLERIQQYNKESV